MSLRDRAARCLVLVVFALAHRGYAADGGPETLPYQATAVHLGVASCASSLCHGAVRSADAGSVRQDEYITWSHDDQHSKAYAVLVSDEARRIADKLGLPAANSAKICLDCHADNVPVAQRGPRFSLSDGVGCEACHGGSEHWISSHSAPQTSYEQSVHSGMFPTASLRPRMTLCLSCHLGSEDKFATHRIMGAGHPRLSFELDTFLALQPPHYQIDDSYRKRKPAYTRTQLWAQGQVLAAEAQLKNLIGPLGHKTGSFPELSLYNCTSCHDSSMHRPDWHRRAFTRDVDPGTPVLNDCYLQMAWLIERVVDEPGAARLLSASQALQFSAAKRPSDVASATAAIESELKSLQERLSASPSQPKRLLSSVLEAGTQGEFSDYLSAEQALMAIDLLLLDAGYEAPNRQQLNKLYEDLKSDETYREGAFIDALRALQSGLGS